MADCMNSTLAAAVKLAGAVVDDHESTLEQLEAALEQLQQAIDGARAEALAEIEGLSMAGEEALRQALSLSRSLQLSFGVRLENLKPAEEAYARLCSPTTGKRLGRMNHGRVVWRQDAGASASAETHRTVVPLLKVLKGEIRFRKRWGIPSGASMLQLAKTRTGKEIQE